MKELPLSNSQVKAIVVDDVVDLLKGFPWMLSKDGYVMCNLGGHFIYMHHLIIGRPTKGLVTDHKNRIKHDNQRRNLHHVTHAQNMHNKVRTGSSRFLGVFYDKTKNLWRARIKKDNRRYELGRHVEEELAALAYDNKAFELYGDKATLNFPELKIQKIAVE